MTDDDAAEGYVEEIPYTYGYHPDLDPARMQAALRRAGVEPPEVSIACELGYGQGLSLAIHAVAGGARWWGTDLLAAHAANVRALVAGTAARLVAADQPFAVFCARDDLPQFDFIGLYGVWSWVSAANRDCILHFAARREHVVRSIRPMLEAGAWVICDRFADSTLAYQGAGQGLAHETWARLCDLTLEGLKPDLTLILDLPVEAGLARAAGRSAADRYEGLGAAFHARIRAGFQEIAQRDQIGRAHV